MSVHLGNAMLSNAMQANCAFVRNEWWKVSRTTEEEMGLEPRQSCGHCA